MRGIVRPSGLIAGVALACLCAPRSAVAQEPAGDPAVTAAAHAIRAALAKPQFYALAVAKPPSFAELTRTWKLDLTPTLPPATTGRSAVGGIDLLQLVHWMVEAHRDREIRLIRERIDREVQALTPKQ